MLEITFKNLWKQGEVQFSDAILLHKQSILSFCLKEEIWFYFEYTTLLLLCLWTDYLYISVQKLKDDLRKESSVLNVKTLKKDINKWEDASEGKSGRTELAF